FTLTVTTLPTITAATNVKRSQGGLSSNSQIATVNDADQTENTLIVTVNGGASATVNGVTVSNIVVDAGGNVTATIVANATATTATFTLRVTDAQGAFAEATLTVTVVVGGFEADVAPRPNGDGNGIVNAGDVTQIQRFAVGLNLPYQSNELQRADCAPQATLGSGAVNAGDVTQAQRYAVGLDGGTVAAGGPAARGSLSVDGAVDEEGKGGEGAPGAIASTYEVRAVKYFLTGSTLTVAIQLTTGAGKTGAASVGGTLRFETAKIGTPTNFRLGSGAPANTSFFVNDADTANGRLGFTINAPVNQTFATGEQYLLLIDFTVIGSGETTLSFDDSQAQRFVGDANGNQFTTATFPPTTISLTPTAAGVTVSGRVLDREGRGVSKARVTMQDQEGNVFASLTNPFGYFLITDLTAGGTYVAEVRHRRLRFE
ncbi:MAG: carboxypeptidase regulatory-like domain-containing protein, partial [Acidobacteria bacterium]|nr:carboxypeptidase regulatory-like domain-containing protein [Acidobacteriota bacterium]